MIGAIVYMYHFKNCHQGITVSENYRPVEKCQHFIKFSFLGSKTWLKSLVGKSNHILCFDIL